MNITLAIPISGIFALIIIAYLTVSIFKEDTGTPEMQGIACAIREGAYAFLRRQYMTIYMLALVACVVLYFVTSARVGYHTAVAFLLGAACSGIAGYIGMYVAVNSNVRASAGAYHSFDRSLRISFRGGAVNGLAMTALSLLGIAGLFYFYGGASAFSSGTVSHEAVKVAPELIVGFGFGASFVALFAQLGGGIYAKAADVGADLVGKVEAGIPEDDLRNPAVVADLVGDNVGDSAGRGADLFESTAAENIGAMIIGIALYPHFGVNGILFPLVARAFGILASIIGIFVVRAREGADPMKALCRGYFVTTLGCAAFLYLVVTNMLSAPGVNSMYFYGCVLIGLALSNVYVILTQYYTDLNYRPVKEIAESCTSGPATTIIQGTAVGMESAFLPVIAICLAIYASYTLGDASGLAGGGLYGTAVATTGMLATCTYMLALDAFGSIADNAGGIVEMAGAPEEVRLRTDRLDSCGNTTKALTKGYAIGSAAMATLLLFRAYIVEVIRIISHTKTELITIMDLPVVNGQVVNYPVDIGKPEVFIGAFIGAMLVMLFSSTAIRAVGNAAQVVSIEVRRQFKEIPGIMEGTAKPEYGTCVDIVTRAALKEMVLPGMILVITPIVVGWLLGAEAVAAFLMVATITGVMMALFLNNGGGAWDSAKKFIELGNFGGKGSEAHKASVIGDSVGDPFKDTAGPSLHVLVKLISTITLVLAALFI